MFPNGFSFKKKTRSNYSIQVYKSPKSEKQKYKMIKYVTDVLTTGDNRAPAEHLMFGVFFSFKEEVGPIFAVK